MALAIVLFNFNLSLEAKFQVDYGNTFITLQLASLWEKHLRIENCLNDTNSRLGMIFRWISGLKSTFSDICDSYFVISNFNYFEKIIMDTPGFDPGSSRFEVECWNHVAIRDKMLLMLLLWYTYNIYQSRKRNEMLFDILPLL